MKADGKRKEVVLDIPIAEFRRRMAENSQKSQLFARVKKTYIGWYENDHFAFHVPYQFFHSTPRWQGYYYELSGHAFDESDQTRVVWQCKIRWQMIGLRLAIVAASLAILFLVLQARYIDIEQLNLILDTLWVNPQVYLILAGYIILTFILLRFQRVNLAVDLPEEWKEWEAEYR